MPLPGEQLQTAVTTMKDDVKGTATCTVWYYVSDELAERIRIENGSTVRCAYYARAGSSTTPFYSYVAAPGETKQYDFRPNEKYNLNTNGVSIIMMDS